MSTADVDEEINLAKPRSFERLWPFLRYSFLAFIVAAAALAISNLLALQFHYTFLYGEFASDDVMQAAADMTDLHQGLAAILYITAFISSIIAYSRFQYRAMKNLHIIDAAGVTTSPGWSVGYFFVPIVNLWKPFGAVCQIWRGTFDPENGDAPVPKIIGWWWVVWLISNFIDNASNRLSIKAGAFGDELTDIDLFMGTLMLDVVVIIFSAASALLVINFMSKIRDGQDILIQRSLASEF